MSSTIPRGLAVFAAAALILGCGADSSTPSGPSSTTLDVATLLSQMSVGNINAIPGANAGAAALTGMTAVPVGAASATIVPSACAYSTATGGFACPPRTVNGITFSASYFLYDAAGHSLTTPDASVVATLRAVTDASGSLTALAGTTGTATFTDHEDMTLSGLLTTTRTLNGTGKSSFDITMTAPAAFHAILNQTSTTANLVLPSRSGTSSWPQSGSITSDIQATTSAAGAPSLTLPIHTVVTFNGTSIVTTTTTSDSFTMTCTIDLSGKTAPHCSIT